MAIFHSTTKIISRSKGRSAVASAAYRAGEKLFNQCSGQTHNFTQKKGVAYKQIILPKDAPREFSDRQTLWNAVEIAEKRKDAQTAREIELGLPREFSPDEQITLLKEYVTTNFVNAGMCVDLAIHDKKDGNPHAHIMLTMRKVTPQGFEKKARGWNDRQLVSQWRQSWAELCNVQLKKNALKLAWITAASSSKQSSKNQPFT